MGFLLRKDDFLSIDWILSLRSDAFLLRSVDFTYETSGRVGGTGRRGGIYSGEYVYTTKATICP